MKELGRLINRKLIVIIIAAACICAVAILVRDASDCGIDNYSQKIREYKWLEEGHTEEERQQHSDNLSQDEKRIFKRLSREYDEKINYIEEYHTSVKGVILNAQNMKKFSIFGTNSSISNIEKTERDYKRIEEIDVRVLNNRAIDQFLNLDISIYVILALMIYVIYNIYEYRDNGMWQLAYTTGNGRMKLAAKDVAAIYIIVLTGTFIMQACGVITMLCVYGGSENITASVQCLTGYNNYTLPVSVITYLFIRYMVVSLIIITISLVISMIFAVCRKRIASIVLVGIIAGAEAYAYQNISLQSSLRIFKKINIINVMDVSNIIKHYDNAVLGNISVSVVSVLSGVCLVLCIISSFFLILMGKVIRPGRKTGFIGKVIEKIGCEIQKVLGGLPHFWKEIYKLVITGRGWIVICIVVFLTIFVSNSQRITYSDDEKRKDLYYQQYGGKDYSGFTELIEERKADVVEAQKKLENAQERFSAGDIDESTLSKYVYNFKDATRLLGNMSEYMQRIEYVEGVKEQYGVDAYVMSQRGYDQILGEKATTRRLLIFIVLGFGIVLIAETENSIEYKSGMNMIIGSSKKGRRWGKTVKAFAVCLIVAIMAFITYTSEMVIMYKSYGMPYIDAPLISLSYMDVGRMFSSVTIKQYMLLLLLIEVIYAVIISIETMTASRYIFKKNSGKGVPALIVLNTILLFIII